MVCQTLQLFGEIYNARLGQYRKQNQFDFLDWSKILEESVKHRFRKNWLQRIDTQSRNDHIQTKETLVKHFRQYGLNCVSEHILRVRSIIKSSVNELINNTGKSISYNILGGQNLACVFLIWCVPAHVSAIACLSHPGLYIYNFFTYFLYMYIHIHKYIYIYKISEKIVTI